MNKLLIAINIILATALVFSCIHLINVKPKVIATSTIAGEQLVEIREGNEINLYKLENEKLKLIDLD